MADQRDAEGDEPGRGDDGVAFKQSGAPGGDALKTVFVAVGVPAATWFGIGAFWQYLRWAGEAPTYYIASMVGLRGLLFGPVQLITVTVLAIALRGALASTPWSVLRVAVVVAGLLGTTGDVIGKHFSSTGAQATADAVWKWVPLLIGPTVMLLMACVVSWLPNKTPKSAAPNDAGG